MTTDAFATVVMSLAPSVDRAMLEFSVYNAVTRTTKVRPLLRIVVDIEGGGPAVDIHIDEGANVDMSP